MELPAEIRNLIYTYALTDPSGFHFVTAFKHRRRVTERISVNLAHQLAQEGFIIRKLNSELRKNHKRPATLVPSLLAVSKQIYSEGQDILYGNEFSFVDTPALYAFMINLGSNAKKCLKSVRVASWARGSGSKTYNHACFSVLAGAVNLENFYLDASLRYYSRTPVAMAGKIYRNAFPWMEAVGMARGRADAAVDIMRYKIYEWRYTDWKTRQVVRHTAKEAEMLFSDKLRELLGAHQKRILAKPVVRKKAASAEDEESGESEESEEDL